MTAFRQEPSRKDIARCLPIGRETAGPEGELSPHILYQNSRRRTSFLLADHLTKLHEAYLQHYHKFRAHSSDCAASTREKEKQSQDLAAEARLFISNINSTTSLPFQFSWAPGEPSKRSTFSYFLVC